MDEHVQRAWKTAFFLRNAKDKPSALSQKFLRQSTSDYPIIQNWVEENVHAITIRNIGELYTRLRDRADLLDAADKEGKNKVAASLDAVDAKHGKDNLGPLHFEALETALHQAENDHHLMRIWPALQATMRTAGREIPDLQGAQEVKNWLGDPANQPHLDAVRYLDISHLGLTTIPQEFATLQLPDLRCLLLNNNQLVSLPDSFLQNCPLLRSVTLSFNELVSLPDGFLQHCPELQWVFLQENKLASLPDGFLQNCQFLRGIRLNKNKLSSLPHNFLQNSQRIEEISLQDNCLFGLPAGFLQNCQRLANVHLQNNKLSSLPEGFLQNGPNLFTVSLDCNQLSCLPDDFLQNRESLVVVLLHRNLLSSPPEGFLKGCRKLRNLSLDTNLLLPRGFIENHPQLECLWVSQDDDLPYARADAPRYSNSCHLNRAKIPSALFQKFLR